MIGPMMPSSKYAIAWCEHCNNYIPKVKWTDEMDIAYGALKQGLQTPGRLYRGLFVFPLAVAAFVGALFLLINLTDNRQKNKAATVKEAIAHPQAGDIFQVLRSDGSRTDYTYYKVSRTNGDSVYLKPSTVHKSNTKEWDNVPAEESDYQPQEMAFSISQSAKEDMFLSKGEHPEYDMVWGVWKEGKLIKKY